MTPRTFEATANGGLMARSSLAHGIRVSDR
jgi:hypothetical protein